MDFVYRLILVSTIIIVLIILRRIIVEKEFYITSRYKDKRKLNIIENGKGVFNTIEKAMKKSNFKRIRYNKDKNEFRAITYPSFWSWCEIIRIKIAPSKEIDFLSVSGFPLQIFDGYKNERNANAFFKNLDN